MLQTVLIVFHLMVVIALVIVVLLQRSEGGALGIGSSSGGFMSGRAQANVLTRATAVLGTLFFATSLALTILANLHRAPRSIFDQTAPAGQSAPGQAPGGRAQRAEVAAVRPGGEHLGPQQRHLLRKSIEVAAPELP